MGIVRITEEDVKKNVRNYRIKQTFFVLGVMAVSVIIIVSLIVYYNIKQRALVGALYLSDENILILISIRYRQALMQCLRQDIQLKATHIY